MVVTIIDYGAGNIGSIKNMLKRIGAEVEISDDPEKIKKADKLILPGVGSFDFGMSMLEKSGLISELNKAVLIDKKPILGICLGVQLMTEGSDEGTRPGLGWFKAKTIRFNIDRKNSPLKVPHMGWDHINIKKQSKLFINANEPRFYFVHSFHLLADNPLDVLCTADYSYEFAAGLERDNIMGVQFHPEKSHKFGMGLLKNFIMEY